MYGKCREVRVKFSDEMKVKEHAEMKEKLVRTKMVGMLKDGDKFIYFS